MVGRVDPITGRAFSSLHLDAIVEGTIVERIDHKNLNFDVPELLGHVTTGENLTKLIWKLLSDALPHGSLARLKLDMSPSNSFEYYGEG